MKLISIIIIFVTIIITKTIIAQTIVVINIQSLIDNNQIYLSTLKEIEKKQLYYLDEFKITEEKLKEKLMNIEESKLIVTDNEINKEIDSYNEELKNFTIHVENFNYHYQEQIIKIRETVLKEIIKLLENYAIENNVDLILDSTSYLIASNSIDITEKINNDLKEIIIKLEYSDFETN